MRAFLSTRYGSALLAVSVALMSLLSPLADTEGEAAPPPNILFVVMDDVGIDQMKLFGYGGATPPSTPNIQQIAEAGIRFRNTWSMPACTTSRAVFFTARFPFRTNVLNALGPDDLANSMVSPYEMTTPKLLARRGYERALFGKFHLALQGHNPAGLAMPYDLGWSYFAGWLDETGDPSSIDKTAGGVSTKTGKSYSCGFVPSVIADGGADFGSCYMADGSCRNMAIQGLVPPGRTCRDQGGILVPSQSCQVPAPDFLNFNTLNGHYVSPLTYNFKDGSVEQVPPTDPRARRFRAKAVVDEAIAWINEQPAGKPWMATVSFASDHTPHMQPPVNEGATSTLASSDLDCANPAVSRELSNLMIESLDAELGRLLVQTGLAQWNWDGGLIYHPERTDTMVIILGDNGSLATTVKVPFDSSRAKGTAYQTGVWVPLIVAGPLVNGPDRTVSHMVNIADLYALFGEIAGIEDVQKAVPRPIDAKPMLPYIVNPKQAGIRQWNFTQVGPNLQANGTTNGPCTINTGCTQIPPTKGVCEDNGGIWWGTGNDLAGKGVPAQGFKYCCEVNAFVVDQGCQPGQQGCPYNITPLSSIGIRNTNYKIVQNSFKDYLSQKQSCVDTTVTEFYRIDEDAPTPALDTAEAELLQYGPLGSTEQANYDALEAQLAALLSSQPACPGDGNIDFEVNQKDLKDWRFYSKSWGLSSVYDFNLDGVTNDLDRAIIVQNLNTKCSVPEVKKHRNSDNHPLQPTRERRRGLPDPGRH